MTTRLLARSLAAMFPKALGQIVTSVVAGICIAVATNWLLRTETAPVQPVFVVERVAAVPEATPAAAALRRPDIPLFLSVGSLPAPGPEAASPAQGHPRAEVEAVPHMPQAQVPEMRHAIEVATLPPIAAEAAPPPPAPDPAGDRVAQHDGSQKDGFLGRHLPVAQRGIDLVQDETAAIVSVITSTLPLAAPGARGGEQAATSELY